MSADTTGRKTITATLCGAVLSVSAAGCPLVHPGPAPTAEPDCAAVCSHWRELGCEMAEPTPAGQPCESVCRDAQRHWDMRCLAEVASCEDIDRCGLP